MSDTVYCGKSIVIKGPVNRKALEIPALAHEVGQKLISALREALLR
jgi:hypothetical protein